MNISELLLARSFTEARPVAPARRVYSSPPARVRRLTFGGDHVLGRTIPADQGRRVDRRVQQS